MYSATYKWVSLNACTQIYAYCHFRPCGSVRISVNRMYYQPNIRSKPFRKNVLDPLTVFPLGVDVQALNVLFD